MACAKIKRTKYMRNINDNAVQGRLSFNVKNNCMKYFRHEIFAIYGIIFIANLGGLKSSLHNF